MPARKIQTGIRFDEEMLRKITYIAKRNHRSLNAQLEFITQQYIEEYEKEKEKIILSDPENEQKT